METAKQQQNSRIELPPYAVFDVHKHNRDLILQIIQKIFNNAFLVEQNERKMLTTDVHGRIFFEICVYADQQHNARLDYDKLLKHLQKRIDKIRKVSPTVLPRAVLETVLQLKNHYYLDPVYGYSPNYPETIILLDPHKTAINRFLQDMYACASGYNFADSGIASRMSFPDTVMISERFAIDREEWEKMILDMDSRYLIDSYFNDNPNPEKKVLKINFYKDNEEFAVFFPPSADIIKIVKKLCIQILAENCGAVLEKVKKKFARNQKYHLLRDFKTLDFNSFFVPSNIYNTDLNYFWQDVYREIINSNTASPESTTVFAKDSRGHQVICTAAHLVFTYLENLKGEHKREEQRRQQREQDKEPVREMIKASLKPVTVEELQDLPESEGEQLMGSKYTREEFTRLLNNLLNDDKKIIKFTFNNTNFFIYSYSLVNYYYEICSGEKNRVADKLRREWLVEGIPDMERFELHEDDLDPYFLTVLQTAINTIRLNPGIDLLEEVLQPESISNKAFISDFVAAIFISDSPPYIQLRPFSEILQLDLAAIADEIKQKTKKKITPEYVLVTFLEIILMPFFLIFNLFKGDKSGAEKQLPRVNIPAEKKAASKKCAYNETLKTKFQLPADRIELSKKLEILGNEWSDALDIAGGKTDPKYKMEKVDTIKRQIERKFRNFDLQQLDPADLDRYAEKSAEGIARYNTIPRDDIRYRYLINFIKYYIVYINTK
ncbi:MAG TPA: hypothetical protein VKS21_08225 [Spirochaetota bacterium]|nr:hypothetical protein [Spirochaetota bacterium]